MIFSLTKKLEFNCQAVNYFENKITVIAGLIKNTYSNDLFCRQKFY